MARRARLAVKLSKMASAARFSPRATSVIPDKREHKREREQCDGTCGKCLACQDDFVFDQICDEVEGAYADVEPN
jgi:hypothetical protein